MHDRAALPVRGNLRLPFALSTVLALLGAIASVSGLVFGPHAWYAPDPATRPAFLGQDAVTLATGLPLLVVALWLTARGSVRGLLRWSGALFYFAYSYFFHVVGAPFSPLYPVHVAIVGLGLHGLVALLLRLDATALTTHVDAAAPVRLFGGFLVGIAALFLLLWGGMVVQALAAGQALAAVPRHVIAIDGAVLLPLMLYGGARLWRREPAGVALGGLLLVKVTATGLTLVVTTAVSATAGQPADPLQTVLYVIIMAGGFGLLVRFLRGVQQAPPA